MNRRNNHKILRSFKHGLDLENTFEMTKNDAVHAVFSSTAESIAVYYKHGIRHCIMDDCFPYFHTVQKDNSLIFSSTFYSGIDLVAHEHYSSFDEVHKVFKKFNKINSEQANTFFLEAYQHFKLQKNATFTYSYTLEDKKADEIVETGHVLIYEILGDFQLHMEFHFIDTTVVVRCKYIDNKRKQNKVKIYSGNFEAVCKNVFKETAIFSCLDDSTIEFNTDLHELFRLSEIVDF